MSRVFEFNHPLIKDKLSCMRSALTGTQQFRTQLTELTTLMSYEVLRDLGTKRVEIKTPIKKGEFEVLDEEHITLVPILRAGLGMVDGFLSVLPVARVGHIGMYRDESTHKPVEYYYKMPDGIEKGLVIVLDPMLATGGSAVDAITALKERKCENIRLVNIVAAPEGIQMVQKHHPDVDIYIASIDQGLNKDAYIVPGLGDAGDRIFGTK